MRSQDRGVTDWLLERLAAGDLPEEKARELRATLAARNENGRLDALAASNAEILAALPAEQVVPEIARRAARAVARRAPTRRLRPLLALSVVTACATGLAVILVVRDPEGGTRPPATQLDPETIGIKGSKPSLRVHRKTKAGSELLRAGALVRRGDTLQVGYLAAGKRFGVIASIDARGTVTLHLPESPGPATALEHVGERALAHAYELDDSPGFERFIFVTSDAPFATADVARALESGHALPASLATFELTLKKETP